MSLKPLTGGAAPDEDNGKKWDRKFSEDPLVPIGCGVTACVLIGGLRSFAQGNSAKSQMYMRARVFAQGATVTVLAAAAMYRGMFMPKEPSLDPNYKIPGLDERHIVSRSPAPAPAAPVPASVQEDSGQA